MSTSPRFESQSLIGKRPIKQTNCALLVEKISLRLNSTKYCNYGPTSTLAIVTRLLRKIFVMHQPTCFSTEFLSENMVQKKFKRNE